MHLSQIEYDDGTLPALSPDGGAVA
jgi:hypothetical protein